jgi:hypothetical protein
VDTHSDDIDTSDYIDCGDDIDDKSKYFLFLNALLSIVKFRGGGLFAQISYRKTLSTRNKAVQNVCCRDAKTQSTALTGETKQ